MRDTSEETNKGVFEGSENTPILANRIKEGGAVFSTSSSVSDGGGMPTRRDGGLGKGTESLPKRDANMSKTDFVAYAAMVALLGQMRAEGFVTKEDSELIKEKLMVDFHVDCDSTVGMGPYGRGGKQNA